MSNERHDVKQLALDFDAKGPVLKGNNAFSGLSLVVNNATAAQPAAQSLEPNSPEITRIIHELGKTIAW